LFSGNGTIVGAAISSDPVVTFFASVDAPTSATLFGYIFADDPDNTLHPVSGSLTLDPDGRVLTIAPDAPPFMIGACSFDTYIGTLTGIVGSGPALRLTAVPRAVRRSAG